jgi:Mycothiol maleylpyruvate isomerase N-terminal domain
MPTIGRDEAVSILEEGRRAIDDLLARVPADAFERAATIGDGDWSAKDLVGHLATWERVALGRLEAGRAGRAIPPFPAGGVDAFNAREVAANRARSTDELRRDAASTHDELLRSIRQTSDQLWLTTIDAPGQRARLATLVGRALAGPGGRQFRHADAHVADLETFVRTL